MITPRSALKFDLFADSSRKGKLDEVGDTLQVIARHIDFGQLAALADDLLERSDGRKGGLQPIPQRDGSYLGAQAPVQLVG